MSGIRIIVTRKDGSVRETEIMYDRNTGKYCFVNLTSHHVCACRFNTVEEAIQDLDNDPFVDHYDTLQDS